MTLSVQKDRFRHLVSGAILELWKKETGSLASVFIEATVCITSCNSRMTVVQLSDHFPGLIPEPPPTPLAAADKAIQLRSNSSSDAGRICHVVGQKRKMNDDEHHHHHRHHRWNKDNDIQTPGVDKVLGCRGVGSDQFSVCRSQQKQRRRRRRLDSNNNHVIVTKDAGFGGDDDDKVDSCENSEDEDAEENHLWHSPPPFPPPPPATFLGDHASGLFYRMPPDSGFHPFHARHTITENRNKSDKTQTKRATEDSVVQDTQNTTSIIIDDDPANNETIPAQVRSLPAQVRRRSHPNALTGNRDVDLLLSSPQNYTDQVRDAIRSRILNGKPVGGSTPPESQSTPTSTLGPFEALTSAAWSPIKRENPSGVLATAPSLQLVELSRSLTGTAVSGTLQLQQRIAGIRGPVSNVFSSGGVTDPDEKGDRFLGLNGTQFSGQKIERFDGSCEDKTPGGEQKTYSCGFCHKTFMFKSKYHEHLPVHTSARPFECHMCTRTYKYKYDLRVHLRTHLGIPTKSTICPFCEEKFATNKLLRSHMKEAHREPRLVNEGQGTIAMENDPSLSPNANSV